MPSETEGIAQDGLDGHETGSRHEVDRVFDGATGGVRGGGGAPGFEHANARREFHRSARPRQVPHLGLVGSDGRKMREEPLNGGRFRFVVLESSRSVGVDDDGPYLNAYIKRA